MTTGTGLSSFARKFPDRFFDVGIAEQHGSTFAAGLAAAGMKPFFAVYSTFLQRGFDQVIHDVALQKLPVTFCIDRAGLVGEDGPTHHGCFDISYLMQVPNMTVSAPKDGIELQKLLALASRYQNGPLAIRYPRGDVPEIKIEQTLEPLQYGSWEILREGEDLVILAVGSMVYPSWKAADMLDKDGIRASVINCRFLKPIDEEILKGILDNHKLIVTVEEGSRIGGFGQYIGGYLTEHNYQESILKNIALPDKFIEHGKRTELLEDAGLTVGGIASTVLDLIQSNRSIMKSRKE
jgi:1-deoxy-D-xylulose-5-phosphate synthase